MRPVNEWLAMLPTQLQISATSAILRQRGGNTLNNLEDSLYTALNNSFNWSNTREGDDYWRTIADDTRRGTAIIFEHYDHLDVRNARFDESEMLSKKIKLPTTVGEWLELMKPYYFKKAHAAPRYKDRDVTLTSKCTSFQSAIIHYVDGRRSVEGNVFWEYVANHSREYVKNEFKSYVGR